MAAAMEVLRRLFGDAIPQPVASMVTRWRSDEYARGGSLCLPCHGTACNNRSFRRLCLNIVKLPVLRKGLVSAGSYSYVAVGSSAKTYDDLATPVRRRMLFAGALPMLLSADRGV